MADITGLSQMVKNVKDALQPIIKFTYHKIKFTSVKLILINEYDEDCKNVKTHIFGKS